WVAPRRDRVSAKWQATPCPPSSSRQGGVFCLQMALAYGQRVWKAQPDGGLAGFGTSPPRMMRSRLTSGLVDGTADKSASVYGCSGRRYNSRASANSTILPRYMTATRLLICSTTDRS